MEQTLVIYLKFIFMMMPFFALSVFIAMTKDFTDDEKQSIIAKFVISILVACLCFFLFGKYIFDLFGITLDAFRIGAGTVLFLNALSMIQGNVKADKSKDGDSHDIAIVPLTIPVTIGPGMIGILMVMGAEANTVTAIVEVVVALIGAALTVGLMLLVSNQFLHLLGKQGLSVMPKITGLFVSAIGAQVVFDGIKGFLNL